MSPYQAKSPGRWASRPCGGKPFGNLRGKDDDEQRHQSYGEGQPVGLSEAGEVDAPFRDEFRGKILEAETEEVVDLSGEYRKGDTGGKAYHNRVRDELDDRSELEEPHKDKYHASHKGSHGQTFHTETGDDAVDNHDECPRRASDLHGVSSESRHHETAQDGGHQSYGGTHAAGDGERDGKRKGHDADDDSRRQVGLQFRSVVMLHRRPQFGPELNFL